MTTDSASELTWRFPIRDELECVYPMLVAAYRAADPNVPDDPRYFARYTECDPHHRDGLWIVGECDGRIATGLRIVARELVCEGGRRARMAGIANVGTHPDFLGRGYATKLLHRSLEVMEREDFEISLLYTGVHPLYAGVGWEAMRLPKRWLKLDAALAATVSGAYTLRQVPCDGWEAIAAGLYAERYANFHGAVARSPAYWRQWIGAFKLTHWPWRMALAFKGREPVAYLVGQLETSGEQRELVIAEGCAREGEEAALPELVCSLGAGAEAVDWPEVPWLTDALASFAGEVQHLDRDGGMVRRVRPGEALPTWSYLLSELDRF